MTSSHSRYSRFAILLHWLMAVTIIGLFASGIISHELDRATAKPVIGMHKSFGVTVWLLVWVRLGWRFYHPPPPPLGRGLITRAASLAHGLLYGLMMLVPVAGYIMTATNPFQIPTYLFNVIPLTYLGLPADRALAQLFGTFHEIGAKVLMALVLVHSAGALFHHFILKDDTLRRMIKSSL
ncbi:MAG: cytochrome b [Pseudomonadota bacterium]